MIAHQVAKVYSTALFNIVRKNGLIDEANDQFESLDALINMDDSLLHFLLAPHILDQQKIALLKDVLGPRLNPLFMEFLLVLVNKHRIGYLHEIIGAFRLLVAEARGIQITRVITAKALSDADRADLQARLAVRTGKTIEIEERVDPTILGGVIVILGDQIIDGSVRHGLSMLKEELMKLKVA